MLSTKKPKPLTKLSDLPYELKEQLAFRCDYWSYEKLRACDIVFHSMPASKTVQFEEFQNLLQKLELEIWKFGRLREGILVE